MSGLRLPLRRRRGGSYTVIVLASSILILATASVLMRSVGHTYSLTAMDSRRSRAREAAFSGLRWAQTHAERAGVETTQATLQLATGEVQVRCERDGEGLEVVCTSRDLDLDYTLRARLDRAEGGGFAAGPYVLETRARQPR
ncbi:MAG: hypothetical protein R3F62_13780 [Planctomycetota bacterium]